MPCTWRVLYSLTPQDARPTAARAEHVFLSHNNMGVHGLRADLKYVDWQHRPATVERIEYELELEGALFHAAERGELEAVRYLLDAGMSPDRMDSGSGEHLLVVASGEVDVLLRAYMLPPPPPPVSKPLESSRREQLREMVETWNRLKEKEPVHMHMRRWRAAARLIGKLMLMHCRASERAYAPGGGGYEACRKEFEELAGSASTQRRRGARGTPKRQRRQRKPPAAFAPSDFVGRTVAEMNQALEKHLLRESDRARAK